MNKNIQRESERGNTELGWLHSKHSFSFGEYYDPEKMGFGKLRVLNDDIVEPGQGFGLHPHNNMEIFSLVLEGALKHKDNIGNGSVIQKDEIQIMSAGTGVLHSEYNPSDSERVNFLQIWIIPKERNVKPRYNQMKFLSEERSNKLLKVISGNKTESILYINQDAAVTLGNLKAGNSVNYEFNYPGNGIYLLNLAGALTAADESLSSRDALAITGADNLTITAKTDSDFILIEVPVN